MSASRCASPKRVFAGCDKGVADFDEMQAFKDNQQDPKARSCSTCGRHVKAYSGDEYVVKIRDKGNPHEA